MASVSERSFSLNPNAPLFVPFAFRAVEDFSSEWWELIKKSPWFQHYWLSQHQEDDFDSIVDDYDMTNTLLESFDIDTAEELIDLEDEFENMVLSTDEKPEPIQTAQKDAIKGSEMDAKKVLKELAIPKSPKKKGPKSPVGSGKYNEKPAKCVSPKYTPRTRIIHQPR